MGLPVRRTTHLRPRELDGTGGCAARPSGSGGQYTVATVQVEALLGRSPMEGGIPLFVFDAGYDPVKLQQGLESSPCQILVRLRAGRCFYGDPSLAGPPATTGRPRRHGPKFDCKDPSTWPEPTA